MLRSTGLVVALTVVLAGIAGATEYIPLDLYSRVPVGTTVIVKN